MSTTTNLGLTKFTQGTKPWDVGMNANLDTVDSAIHGIKTQPLGACNVVAYSANPVFDLSKGTSHKITLAGNTTTPTFTNPVDGQIYVFIIQQDATGGRPFSFPAIGGSGNGFWNADDISTANGNANGGFICVQVFVYLAVFSEFIKIAPTMYG